MGLITQLYEGAAKADRETAEAKAQEIIEWAEVIAEAIDAYMTAPQPEEAE